ncbi:MAG: AAA family ATPase [Candidatus Heimdallarchaeota archaeon]
MDNVADFYEIVHEQVRRRIVGREGIIRNVMVVLLARGHVLLEGVPGLAKTLIASTLADILGMSFRRAQFTPDLLPADITGANVYNQKEGEFTFVPGPVFTNFLLCDEINRAPPKTQAALLEAMQEKQTSIEGVTRPLPEPFFVIATQNPIEQSGVYPLPEAQIDRFSIRLIMSPPAYRQELHILQLKRADLYPAVKQVGDSAMIQKFQAQIESGIKVSDQILEYIAQIVTQTRTIDALALGGSPRASIALLSLSKVVAALQRRDYVQPDDVKSLVFPVLNHRLILRPEAALGGSVNVAQLLEGIIRKSEVVL